MGDCRRQIFIRKELSYDTGNLIQLAAAWSGLISKIIGFYISFISSGSWNLTFIFIDARSSLPTWLSIRLRWLLVWVPLQSFKFVILFGLNSKFSNVVLSYTWNSTWKLMALFQFYFVSWSRNLKVDGCRSNLYVILKQVLFFIRFTTSFVGSIL